MASSNQVSTNTSNIDVSSMSTEDIMAHPSTLTALFSRMAQHFDNIRSIDEEEDDDKEPEKKLEPNEKHSTPEKRRNPARKCVKKREEPAIILGHNPDLDPERMSEVLIKRFKTAPRKKTCNPKPASTKEDGESSDLPELSSSSEDEPDPEKKSDKDNKRLYPHYEVKKKLSAMHYGKICSMTASEVGKICKQVLPELRKIQFRILRSERHEIFMRKLRRREPLNFALMPIRIFLPFSYGQDREIRNIIENKLYNGIDVFNYSPEVFKYIDNVLMPEALIRIFARVNKIDTVLAEKELMHQGKYEGPLPPYIISKLPDDLRMLLDQ